MTRLAAIALLPAVLLLAACATAHSISAAVPLHTVAATSAATSAAPAATSVKPGDAAEATCTDSMGDGGGFDITQVSVTRSGTAAVVVKVTVSKLPDVPEQAASLVLTAYDSTGNSGGIFTTDWLGGGKPALVSVFDDTTVHNSYVSTTPTVNAHAKTITTDFPSTLFDTMGTGWVWKLATTLGDTDQDSCSTIPASLD